MKTEESDHGVKRKEEENRLTYFLLDDEQKFMLTGKVPVYVCTV